MYPRMLVQYGPLSKLASTIDTGVGLLVVVDTQVLHEVALLSKPLPAITTGVRPGESRKGKSSTLNFLLTSID